MNHSSPALALVLSASLGLAACGPPKPVATQTAPAPTSAPQPAPAAPAESASPAAALPRTASPPGASVAILSPRNGDTVSSPVKVVFDIQGMTLAPAGDAAPNSGHHHLLVDAPLPDLSQPLPKDDQHLHFGKAQTEAEVTLAPGSHTLQLVLGDANHVPQDPPVVSELITITVK